MSDLPIENGPVELTPEENRAAAAFMLPLLTEAYRSSLEGAASQARWFWATLALINGGGLVALMPASLPVWSKLLAGLFFVIGMSLCLLSAHRSVAAFQGQVSMTFGRILGYWHSVLQDGERIPEWEDELNKEIDDAVKTPLFRRLGIGSFAAFSLGCVIIGAGMATA